MFEAMLARIREQTVEYLFKVEAPKAPPPPRIPETPPAGEAVDGMIEESPASAPVRPSSPSGRGVLSGATAVPVEIQKIGRNDPCFCGSGKKFKKCHGAGSEN